MRLSIKIFQGRSFDKLPPNHAVRVQGVLCDLVQETSPATSTHSKSFGSPQPTWENDNGGLLSWSLTKEQLNSVKAQGGSLKLYCFSTTRRSQGTASDEQSLGYILLNVNSPSMYQAEADTSPEWHKLRGVSRTMELKLRATINSSLPTNLGQRGLVTGRRNAFDDVVVSEDAEYIPIGSGGGNDVFTLDVTLAGVDALKGIATTVHGPYYLTYGMFGVVTETDTFDSLSQPLFHPIVDSFRVQSNRANLSHFFGHEVLPLEIRLCGARNQIVAVAKVDCAPLAGAIGAPEFHGAELEGTYPFHPLDQTVTVTTGKPMLFAAVAVRPVKEEEQNPAGQVVQVQETVEDCIEHAPTAAPTTFTTSGVVDVEEMRQTSRGDVPQIEEQNDYNDDDDNFEDDDFEDDDFEDDERGTSSTAANVTTATAAQGQPTEQKRQEEEQRNSTAQSSAFSPPSSVAVPTSAPIEVPSNNDGNNGMAERRHPESPESDGGSDVDNVNLLRRYRLSVDLRSIRNVAKPSTVYLTYTLPTFGAVSAVRTRPPIALTKNSESLLPHGYQMYEVCLTREQVVAALNDTPLTIDVVRKDKYQTDTALGTATVPLAQLMGAKRFYRDSRTRKTFSSFAMLRSFQKSGGGGSRGGSGGGMKDGNGKSKHVTVRTEDRYVQVLQSNDGGRISKVASLRVVVILEDLGEAKGLLAKASNVAVQAATRIGERHAAGSSTTAPTATIRGEGLFGTSARMEYASSLGYATSGRNGRMMAASPSGGRGGSAGPYDPADDPQNQEALADWVASEYEKWENGMKRKEEERMNVLENVWSQREEERTAAINSVQKSYTTLEAQLRQKLDTVENRERALHLKELELNRRTEVQAGELRIQQRRLEEELQHKISIERRKVEELTSRVKQLTRGRNAAEDRARKVESDFAQYRHDQRSTPEAVLHARVTELTSKVAELQLNVEVEHQKFESESASKVECQAQLGRLVRELQAMRREQRIVAERNMEQLRLQYIAREERYVLDGDRQELRSIKNELDDLRRVTLVQSQGVRMQAPTPSRGAAERDIERNVESTLATIQRLEQERSDLMATGAYGPTHPIIEALQRKIIGIGGSMRDSSA